MKKVGSRTIETAKLSGLDANTKERFRDRMVSDDFWSFWGSVGKGADEALDEAERSVKSAHAGDWQILKPYFKWIVQKYAKGSIRKWEDVGSRVVPALLDFDRLKRRNKLEPQEKDVNRLKGIQDLEDLAEKYADEDKSSGSERDKEKEQGFYDRGEALLIYNGPKIKIVEPKSTDAARFFGRNTRWCTAAKKHNMFSHYRRKKLVVLDFKRSGPKGKIQMTGDMSEVMDARDEEIELSPRRLTKPAREALFSWAQGIGRRAQNSSWFKLDPDMYEKKLGTKVRLASQDSSEVFMGKMDLSDMEVIFPDLPVSLICEDCDLRGTKFRGHVNHAVPDNLDVGGTVDMRMSEVSNTTVNLARTRRGLHSIYARGAVIRGTRRVSSTSGHDPTLVFKPRRNLKVAFSGGWGLEGLIATLRRNFPKENGIVGDWVWKSKHAEIVIDDMDNVLLYVNKGHEIVL